MSYLHYQGRDGDTAVVPGCSSRSVRFAPLPFRTCIKRGQLLPVGRHHWGGGRGEGYTSRTLRSAGGGRIPSTPLEETGRPVGLSAGWLASLLRSLLFRRFGKGIPAASATPVFPLSASATLPASSLHREGRPRRVKQQ